jgi:hypothetical protein
MASLFRVLMVGPGQDNVSWPLAPTPSHQKDPSEKTGAEGDAARGPGIGGSPCPRAFHGAPAVFRHVLYLVACGARKMPSLFGQWIQNAVMGRGFKIFIGAAGSFFKAVHRFADGLSAHAFGMDWVGWVDGSEGLARPVCGAVNAVAGLFHITAKASGGITGGENACRDSREDAGGHAANKGFFVHGG